MTNIQYICGSFDFLVHVKPYGQIDITIKRHSVIMRERVIVSEALIAHAEGRSTLNILG